MTIPAEEAGRDRDMVDAVADAGGNPWAAIRALLEENERLEWRVKALERENAQLKDQRSPGYARLPPTQH
jgi:hypothetical protein